MTAAARLVLGTAQLGMAYGSARLRPLPDAAAAAAVLRRALDLGVRHFDTARAYGLSEERLGDALIGVDDVEIVTKLSGLDLPLDADAGTVCAAVDAGLDCSRRALRRDVLPVVALHWEGDRVAWGGAAWDRLRRWRDDGKIGRLGVSVSSIDPVGEALRSVADFDVQHLQIPCNLLDRRWNEAGLPARLALRPDLTVHTRNTLLQGLLAQPDPAAWPNLEGLRPQALLDWLERQAQAFGRSGPVDLCLAYLRGRPWVNGVVVGAESLDQVECNVGLFAAQPLSAADGDALLASRPAIPDALLRPGLWPAASQP